MHARLQAPAGRARETCRGTRSNPLRGVAMGDRAARIRTMAESKRAKRIRRPKGARTALEIVEGAASAGGP